jgi:cysteate synthase
MLDYDDNRARRDAEIIDAKVLSNRRPPYGLVGGRDDALKDTDGDIVVATNAQARRAAALFLETEGVDIHPAAAVATASLAKAVADGRVERDKIVMLNITGGGEALYKSTLAAAGKELWHLKPSHVFAVDATPEEVVETVEGLFPQDN